MKKNPKIKPFKWTFNGGSVVEHYRFNELTTSNPPPIGYDTPVIPFGKRSEYGAWVMP